jgi:exonuclease III
MKIATFNINDVNKRLDNLIGWLRTEKPDVVALQELKAADHELELQRVPSLPAEDGIATVDARGLLHPTARASIVAFRVRRGVQAVPNMTAASGGAHSRYVDFFR